MLRHGARAMGQLNCDGPAAECAYAAIAIAEEASFADPPGRARAFSTAHLPCGHQQLKQQKHELLSSQREERRRARTSENINAAVLSNLSCGVVLYP